MVGIRRAICPMIFVASSVWAANGRPIIEIHPVVECSINPGSEPLTVDVQAAVDSYGKPFAACVGQDAAVGGTDFVAGRYVRNNRIGQDCLTVTLSPDGRQHFFQFALGHQAEQFAIIVDGRQVSAPVLMGATPARTLEICGGLSAAEIDSLVQRFKPPI